jgi:anti-sigma regulatory factor (Ser/Thr protein kinase)
VRDASFVDRTLECPHPKRWSLGQAGIPWSAVPETLITRPKHRAFPGRPDQIALARDFTRRVVGPCPVLDEAILLVSELATNAIEHTATANDGSFHVTICQGDSSLLIAVTDDGSDNVPMRAHPTNTLAEAGRGLELVELIADRWGHYGERQHCTVWFELSWTRSAPVR